MGYVGGMPTWTVRLRQGQPEDVSAGRLEVEGGALVFYGLDGDGSSSVIELVISADEFDRCELLVGTPAPGAPVVRPEPIIP